MRKIIFLTLAGLLGLGLLTTGALADPYDFNPTTQVQWWYMGHAINGGGTWSTIIGANPPFGISGANLSGNHLQIFTNWGGASFTDVLRNSNGTPIFSTMAADLFIDTNGDHIWDYAIRLRDDGTGSFGNIYSRTVAGWSYQTSVDVCGGNGSIYYGGAFRNPPASSGTPTPVNATGGFLSTSNAVHWINLPGTSPDYMVDINLGLISGFNAANGFAFLYATGECGNSVLYGEQSPVPLPPSVLLLGSGLVVLVLLGRRRRAYASVN